MPSHVPFVHLHVHSHYSIGDSINKISDIYQKASQMNMKAVALTDHGNLFGAADFFISSAKPKIKPIIGCEMYVTPYDATKKKINEGERNFYHLVLLVKDHEGYKNLVELVSYAYVEGFYYKPRIDFKKLEEHSKGLIALTACLGGEIPILIGNNEMQEAKKRCDYYHELFGKDNFYLEIMNNGIEKQNIVNKGLLEISKSNHIPLVATNDVHYPERADEPYHDVFLCISAGKKVKDIARKRYETDQFYFRSYEEMHSLFENISLEAVHNTAVVADYCNYFPELGKLNLPDFKVPDGTTPELYLRQMCYDNLEKKIGKKPETAIKERLEFELETIEKMGFPGYFLIVQDFINWSKKNGISVGPGRGSAAGSLVSFLTGITELNPIKYDLLFERFLNPGRVSMPDIDTDFDDMGREAVIEYVKKKYGEEYVAQIITFGKLKARAAVKDVGRVMDISLDEVNAITKLIPGTPDMTMEKAYKDVPDLKSKIEGNEGYKDLWMKALRLEGLIRNTSLHAAGIVISKDKLSSTVPLYKDTKTGAIATQFEGKHLEEFGLMKMDFLGLRNLRIIEQAMKQIEIHKGKKIDLLNLPLDDKKTFKLLQEGKGIGVFQLESEGMQELMKKLSPSKFEEIIALIALYRPGPLNSGMTDDFVKRKKSPDLVSYPHKDLTHSLEDTYGVIVYQEQVMRISQIIGGFSLEQADNLRKAMGKKDGKKMGEMSEKFLAGAKEKNYEPAFADNLFQQMAKFAEYGFNKSHSAAYALIAYQTAYLKAHYPVEYMCAMLNAEKGGKIEKLMIYLKECKILKIDVLPPHINSSFSDFEIEGKKGIRFGLSAVKNIGETNIRFIIDERNKMGNFTSLSDLLNRVEINKKVMENLVLSGALDGLIPNRASVIHNMERILQFSTLKKKERNSGMGGLFESSAQNTSQEEIHLDIIGEYKENELLKMEKINLGLYVTGHPLAKYADKIVAYSTKTSSALKEIKTMIDNDDQAGLEIPDIVQLAGMIIGIEYKKTKNNDDMAILTLEDLESELKVVIFPKTFKKVVDKLVLDEPILIKGKAIFDQKEAQINAEEIQLLKPLPEKVKTSIINIKLDEKCINEENINFLKKIFSASRGLHPIIFHMYDLDLNRKVNIRVGQEYYIAISDAVQERIKQVSCVEGLWVSESN